MKTNTTLLLALSWLSLIKITTAATLIVDTFEQGNFFTDIMGGFNQDVTLPFAVHRSHSLGGCPLPGAHLATALNSALGTVTLSVSGTPAGNTPYCPLGLDLIYWGSGPHDITSYTGFMLGFTELSGSGTLYVEVGGEEGFGIVNRLEIPGAGDFFYPLSRVYENTGASLDSFRVLKFTFEARTTEFSFTLDEIRLVPEPGSAALLGLAALGVCRRKRPSL
jgi:PEP-CTERM motif